MHIGSCGLSILSCPSMLAWTPALVAQAMLQLYSSTASPGQQPLHRACACALFGVCRLAASHCQARVFGQQFAKL